MYDLELERRVTIIRGLSGTGKTFLWDLVRRSVNYKREIQVTCERRVRVFDEVPVNWEAWGVNNASTVFVIDEDTYLGKWESEVYRHLREYDCWLIYITRSSEISLELECAISSVKCLHTSGKYKTLVDAMPLRGVTKRPAKIWTEDTNSGYQFFKKIFDNTESVQVGKSWLSSNKLHALRDSLLAFDCAVLGPIFTGVYLVYEDEMFDIINTDSFEKLLLTSSSFNKDNEVHEILENPALYGANDKQYYSWESFFEKKLVEAMLRNHMGTYHKSELPVAFTGDSVVRSILERNGLTVLLGDSGDRIKELRKLLPPSKQDISDDELLEKYGGVL